MTAVHRHAYKNRPLTEGPRQTSQAYGKPTGDQISYKAPAAVVPFPNQSKLKGAMVTPGTPNVAKQVDPNLPPSGITRSVLQQPPEGLASRGSLGPSTLYDQAAAAARKQQALPRRR